MKMIISKIYFYNYLKSLHNRMLDKGFILID